MNNRKNLNSGIHKIICRNFNRLLLVNCRIKLITGCMVLLISAGTLFAKPDNIQKYIMTDQFGYRTGDKKIAVIVNPQIGFNDADEFNPGMTYEVHKWDNDEVLILP